MFSIHWWWPGVDQTGAKSTRLAANRATIFPRRTFPRPRAARRMTPTDRQPITEPVLLDKSSWESIFDATPFSTDDKWFGFLVILLPWWWNMIFHLAIYLYNLMVKRITANWNMSQGIGESFPYWCLSCLQAGKTKINFVNRNLALSTNQLFIKTDISVDVWIPEPPGMSKTQWWILCLRKYHT